MVQAHGKVGGLDVLGQGANGDAVHAGFCQGAQAIERHAARDFEDGAPALMRTASCSMGRGMLSSSTMLGTGVQRLAAAAPAFPLRSR
jgi:hypothetical protein